MFFILHICLLYTASSFADNSKLNLLFPEYETILIVRVADYFYTKCRSELSHPLD